MTAPTRSTIAVFPSTSVPPGGTKAAPVAAGLGPWVDVRSFNGGQLAWSVKNGTAAPSVPGRFAIQVADTADGANTADLVAGYSGDIVTNSETTGLVDLPSEPSYVRMIAFDNATNAVTFKLTLFAKA